MRTNIIMNTRFVGYHYWKDAPIKVDFLKNVHRHEFHVEIKLSVDHDDRELEFCFIKDHLSSFLNGRYKNRTFTESCEQIAGNVLNFIWVEYGLSRKVYVKVMEDGENGAEIYSE